MSYRFLTRKMVIAIHDAILSKTKGLAGVKDEDLVGALCTRVTNMVYYNGEGDVYTRAAMYMIAIARGHVFNDENKRTAAATALYFLSDNGISIDGFMALEDTTVEAAQGLLSVEEVADVLRSM